MSNHSSQDQSAEKIWISPEQSYPCVISSRLDDGIEVYLSSAKVPELYEGYIVKFGRDRRQATVGSIRDDFKTGVSYLTLKWD